MRVLLLFLVFPMLLPAQSYELVWADEFEGRRLDGRNWRAQRGDGCDIGICGWGNNERQWYQGQNAVVADGVLTITAREEAVNGYDYTSARLRTKDLADWTYGRFEMRAKMPVGQGLWPAFWMLPTDNAYGGWAASGEIDIMEYLGHEPNIVHGTIHYGGSWPNNTFTGEPYTLPEGRFDEDFHVFAVEWEQDEMRWYVDDVLYATQTSETWFSAGQARPAPFDKPFHLVLNLAVGGNWPGDPDETTTFPQELVVDYVRVYQRTQATNTEPAGTPQRFRIEQPYPNPFTSETRIRLAPETAQHVRVDVFDALGRPVANAFEGFLPAGTERTVTLDGSDWPSGLYLVRATGDAFQETRRIVRAAE